MPAILGGRGPASICISPFAINSAFEKAAMAIDPEILSLNYDRGRFSGTNLVFSAGFLMFGRRMFRDEIDKWYFENVYREVRPRGGVLLRDDAIFPYPPMAHLIRRWLLQSLLGFSKVRRTWDRSRMIRMGTERLGRTTKFMRSIIAYPPGLRFFFDVCEVWEEINEISSLEEVVRFAGSTYGIGKKCGDGFGRFRVLSSEEVRLNFESLEEGRVVFWSPWIVGELGSMDLVGKFRVHVRNRASRLGLSLSITGVRVKALFPTMVIHVSKGKLIQEPGLAAGTSLEVECNSLQDLAKVGLAHIGGEKKCAGEFLVY